MKHFKSIESVTKEVGMPAPAHPMIMAISFNDLEGIEMQPCNLAVNEAFSTDCYTIALKEVQEGELKYGRTKYDFSNGAMMFTSPRQVLEWSGGSIASKGFFLAFHEDFVRGTDLGNNIKKYGFFSYSANEALHLSAREEQTINALVKSIQEETYNNQDEFSREIMVSHLETLLKYSDRFYKRQFLHRKEFSSDLSSQVDDILRRHFEQNTLREGGVPSIELLAEELNVTARYLSDSLKVETGKTALEYIHLYLIDEAKNLLLQPNVSVADTAYELGFEYPHYFSRLFKKKVGMSPSAYQKQYAVN
ncbi:MAG: helix-turn-helix transcriptional regulator [Cytophagales bacterium]|nr:helix-turn-helix transcriptional regulator [Cytophagales bacterium]